MQKIATSIQDLYLLKANIFQDDRGIFIKQFNHSCFKEINLENNFVESYYSVSRKGVVRGMHFQTPPCEHAKLVYVSFGKILDVVVDLRKDSKTFGQYFHVILDDKEGLSLYIPKGFAHGFLSLENQSKVHYMQTSEYNMQSDSGILFDSFGFDWREKAKKYGIDDFIVSKRDQEFLRFDEFAQRSIF